MSTMVKLGSPELSVGPVGEDLVFPGVFSWGF